MAAIVLVTAPVAAARSEWLSGPSEESSVVSCSSQQNGTPSPVVGAAAFSQKFVDRRRPPRVGKTFFVRVLVGAVGDPCITQQSASVELVLPRGVRVATSPNNRIACFLTDVLTDVRKRISRTDGCPRFTRRGAFGGRALVRGGQLGPNWAVPLGQALEIQVPVRASRTMRGRTKANAGCSRSVGDPPCPRRRAGNHLQFAIRVFDNNANPYLVPHLGLTVRKRAPRRTPPL